jgi:hypothetical protein
MVGFKSVPYSNIWNIHGILYWTQNWEETRENEIISPHFIIYLFDLIIDDVCTSTHKISKQCGVHTPVFQCYLLSIQINFHVNYKIPPIKKETIQRFKTKWLYAKLRSEH